MAARGRPPWGWHRLDDRWARRLVARAGIERGDLVVDVGAGSGSLTEALLRAHATVVAVELHAARARRLRDRFVGQPVTVVQVDAADLRLPRRPFAVVANPPFAALECLLTRLVARGSRLVRAEVVVPRHIARRWTSPTAPGRARWSRTFEVTTGWTLPRSAFHPPPPRDAQVLTIRRLDYAIQRVPVSATSVDCTSRKVRPWGGVQRGRSRPNGGTPTPPTRP